jgi:two-component system sensor histidine kinase BaeS
VTRERGAGPTIALRLLGAFAGVAAVAIAVFAGLTLWAGRSDVNELVRKQQQATISNTVAALTDAYLESGVWSAADLRPARAVAIAGDALLEVRDAKGRLVLQAGRGLGPGPLTGTWPERLLHSTFGPPQTRPIVVGGQRVGTAAVRFPTNTLPPAEHQLRDALTRTVAIGAGIAIVVALAVGWLVAHGITRPLRRLTAAVHRLGAGDRSARANLAAPGELGELAAAVDHMAATLEREDELRRTLTADVAHELRTPVTILTAHHEALADGVEEPTPELLASLQEEVLRLGRLIEDLEALAAAEAAGLRLQREPVDLADVVRRAVELLAPQLRAAEIELSLRLDPGIVVSGDARRLAQIVQNLLANAVKFTPGGGRIDITLTGGDRTARLVFSDTGVGIPADELPHVFDRFWRGRAADGTSGSGIGLAVVDELVRAHRGRASVASTPGEGTTFTVDLPLASPHDLHIFSAAHAPGGASLEATGSIDRSEGK